MAEKKRGFFDRLFRGGAEREEIPPPASPAEAVLDVLEAPLVLPPEQEIALAEALHEAGQQITPADPEIAAAQTAPVAPPAPTGPTAPPVASPAPTPAAPAPKQNWFTRLAT
ncbi:MAG TPA: signal recognition particle-docking protein FtsY, partial [Devosia sp.]|nr:signal recognition particle-docking protein FtsY [Devosia sp.]